MRKSLLAVALFATLLGYVPFAHAGAVANQRSFVMADSQEPTPKPTPPPPPPRRSGYPKPKPTPPPPKP
jgi:hypothetical protein